MVGLGLVAGRRRLTIELLVRERRFDYRNQRHRRALFEADPAGTFGLSAGDPRLEWLRVQAWVHRRDHGRRDRSMAAWAAMNFGEIVRGLDDAAV